MKAKNKHSHTATMLLAAWVHQTAQHSERPGVSRPEICVFAQLNYPGLRQMTRPYAYQEAKKLVADGLLGQVGSEPSGRARNRMLYAPTAAGRAAVEGLIMNDAQDWKDLSCPACEKLADLVHAARLCAPRRLPEIVAARFHSLGEERHQIVNRPFPAGSVEVWAVGTAVLLLDMEHRHLCDLEVLLGFGGGERRKRW